ncbi:2-isopropylmalate synthase protein [Marine Group I thaumarchaeote SCGC RSA3]|uniref:2-isopropylmalate synthase protein n=2 Tax=Marine Group I TaxID=905826 RepID=A0A081RQG9_9ARCH|nr:2-isopropylmalate synthase protein [Marine Group I thaumarchaeote SCGC AAA799-N04]KFM20422.1 2-isopropylmalate synthase protein [Marine Group I thaumarchaeote SCGC RSA3]
MSTAFVVITSEIGEEQNVINQLKTIASVKDVKGVMGAYDIIVKLESDTSKELNNTITNQIRKIKDVRTTLTLTVIDSQE